MSLKRKLDDARKDNLKLVSIVEGLNGENMDLKAQTQMQGQHQQETMKHLNRWKEDYQKQRKLAKKCLSDTLECTRTCRKADALNVLNGTLSVPHSSDVSFGIFCHPVSGGKG